MADLKRFAQRSVHAEEGAASQPDVSDGRLSVVLFKPLLRVVLKEALGGCAVVQLLCGESLDHALDQVLLVLQSLVILFELFFEGFLLLDFLWSMLLKLLLHLELKVVREKLVLLLDVELAGAHSAGLCLLLVLCLDVDGPQDMINAELAGFGAFHLPDILN